MSELEKLKKIRDELNESMSQARGLIGDIDKRIKLLEKLVEEKFAQKDKEIEDTINEFLKEVHLGLVESLDKSTKEVIRVVAMLETKVSKRELHILMEMQKTFEIVDKCYALIAREDIPPLEERLRIFKIAIAGEQRRILHLKESMKMLEEL